MAGRRKLYIPAKAVKFQTAVLLLVLLLVAFASKLMGKEGVWGIGNCENLIELNKLSSLEDSKKWTLFEDFV